MLELPWGTYGTFVTLSYKVDEWTQQSVLTGATYTVSTGIPKAKVQEVEESHRSGSLCREYRGSSQDKKFDMQEIAEQQKR